MTRSSILANAKKQKQKRAEVPTKGQKISTNTRQFLVLLCGLALGSRSRASGMHHAYAINAACGAPAVPPAPWGEGGRRKKALKS
jgi:hypothetical protein